MSSNIVSIGYDALASVLEVEFQAGSVYQYRGVPLTIYTALMGASSVGSYFDMMIKKGGYGFVRIS